MGCQRGHSSVCPPKANLRPKKTLNFGGRLDFLRSALVHGGKPPAIFLTSFAFVKRPQPPLALNPDAAAVGGEQADPSTSTPPSTPKRPRRIADDEMQRELEVAMLATGAAAATATAAPQVRPGLPGLGWLGLRLGLGLGPRYSGWTHKSFVVFVHQRRSDTATDDEP